MSECSEHLSKDDENALEKAERASADLPGQIAHARKVVRDFRRALTGPRPVNDNRPRDRRH
jgi:hypothetical protein